MCQFQRLLFKYWPQLRDLSLANCAAACAPDDLKRALAALKDDELQQLVCRQLRLVGEEDPWAQVWRGGGGKHVDPCMLGDIIKAMSACVWGGTIKGL